MRASPCLPTSIVSGDTVGWSRTLPDYPASAGWGLHYKLVGQPGAYSFDATADGDGFTVALDPGTTKTWAPGLYTLSEYVTDASGARYTLGNSTLIIQPDPATAAAGTDARSQPQRILDAINATLEGRATSADLKTQINGRSIEYIPLTELLALRDRMKLEVAMAQRASGCCGDTGKLYARFVAP